MPCTRSNLLMLTEPKKKFPKSLGRYITKLQHYPPLRGILKKYIYMYMYVTSHVKWTKKNVLCTDGPFLCYVKDGNASYFWSRTGPLLTVLVFCVARLLSLVRNCMSRSNLRLCVPFSYGRVYAADPYHHTLAPAPTYGVGAMVSTSFSSSSLLPASLPTPQLGPSFGLTVDVLSLSLNWICLLC